MSDQTSYRTRKDGSIDYGYYIEKSHVIRSGEAHNTARAVFRSIPDPVGIIRAAMRRLRVSYRTPDSGRHFEASR